METPSLPSYWLPRYFFLSNTPSLSVLTVVLYVQCDLLLDKDFHDFIGNIKQLDDYCKENNFLAWFETSARENIGIDEAMRCLTAKVPNNLQIFDHKVATHLLVFEASSFMQRQGKLWTPCTQYGTL